MTTKKRIDFLDAIMTLFIIKVIVNHTLCFGEIWKTTPILSPLVAFFYFSVPWFMFKSGIFVSRKRDLKTWIVTDFKRLMVPYISFTIIGALCYYAVEVGINGNNLADIFLTPARRVKQVGSEIASLQLWFLLSLFLTRLAYRLLPDKVLPVATVASIVIGAALAHWHILLPFALSTVFPAFFFLMLGKYSRKYIVDEEPKYVKWGGQVAILLLWIVLYVWFKPGCDMRINDPGEHNYFIWAIDSWLGCLSMIIIFRPFLDKIKFLTYIGRYSMMYYVLHYTILYVSKAIVLWFCPDIGPYKLTAVLAVILIVTLALATWKRKWIPSVLLGEQA